MLATHVRYARRRRQLPTTGHCERFVHKCGRLQNTSNPEERTRLVQTTHEHSTAANLLPRAESPPAEPRKLCSAPTTARRYNNGRHDSCKHDQLLKCLRPLPVGWCRSAGRVSAAVEGTPRDNRQREDPREPPPARPAAAVTRASNMGSRRTPGAAMPRTDARDSNSSTLSSQKRPPSSRHEAHTEP